MSQVRDGAIRKLPTSTLLLFLLQRAQCSGGWTERLCVEGDLSGCPTGLDLQAPVTSGWRTLACIWGVLAQVPALGRIPLTGQRCPGHCCSHPPPSEGAR